MDGPEADYDQKLKYEPNIVSLWIRGCYQVWKKWSQGIVEAQKDSEYVKRKESVECLVELGL